MPRFQGITKDGLVTRTVDADGLMEAAKKLREDGYELMSIQEVDGKTNDEPDNNEIDR